MVQDSIIKRAGRIVDGFKLLTGIACSFVFLNDLNKDYLNSLSFNTFCQMISKNNLGNGLCINNKRKLFSSAIKQKKPVIATCHAGLDAFCVPLISNSKVEGVFIGCFLGEDADIAIKKQINLYKNKYEIEPEELLAVLDRLPINKTGSRDALVELLNSMAKLYMTDENQERNVDLNLITADEPDFLSAIQNSHSFTNAANYFGDKLDGYMYTRQNMDNLIIGLFYEVRAKNIVLAKEYFKRCFSGAYGEDSLDKMKYSTIYVLFLIYDIFLQKISRYGKMNNAAMPFIGKVMDAPDLDSIKGVLNNYFDELVNIYGVTNSTRNAVVDRIRIYIDENYMKPINIAELASFYNVSAAYFSREFKTLMGVGPKSYINNTRMLHAQRLLRYTDLPVSVIAEKVGYTNIRGFYKMYHKYYDTTCVHFRQMIPQGKNQ